MREVGAVTPTNRWAGVEAVAWAAIGVGLLSRKPGVLLIAAVGVVFAAYARSGTPPNPELRVRRSIDDPAPIPGQPVSVRLTIENRGDRSLLDVRLVDGVPEGHRVVVGSARVGTVLRVGEVRTFSYVVRAERGTHRFAPVSVLCRSLNGAYETTLEYDVETTMTCRPAVEVAGELPLRSLVSHYGGRLPTERGGSGTEFYGVREHRPGDPANRIDWARRARTGELATLDFRDERLATVVVLVDARRAAYVRARGDETRRTAVEQGVGATADVLGALHDAGNRVGVAVIGTEFAWLAPGTGPLHRHRAGTLLSMRPPLSPDSRQRLYGSPRLSPPSPVVSRRSAGQLRRLEAHLPTDAQVVFVSPLLDDAAVTVARRLQVAGHPVTAVSPDVTEGSTVGVRHARLHRRRRIRAMHRTDVRIVDWGSDESLAVALERGREGWF